jgi:hypothetical protein
MAGASIRNNPAGDRRVTAVHIALGVAVVVVNLAAGAWGAWAWWQERDAPGFWPLLRTGQALVAVEAALGGVLLLAGEDMPPLHLVYGLTPLAVAFFAEQLRLVSAQTELDRRGLAGRDDVARLSEADQRRLVRAILRREIGVMAASALVVGLLGVRASEWL